MGKEQLTPGDDSELKKALKFWGKTLGIVAIGLLGLAILL